MICLPAIAGIGVGLRRTYLINWLARKGYSTGGAMEGVKSRRLKFLMALVISFASTCGYAADWRPLPGNSQIRFGSLLYDADGVVKMGKNYEVTVRELLNDSGVDMWSASVPGLGAGSYIDSTMIFQCASRTFLEKYVTYHNQAGAQVGYTDSNGTPPDSVDSSRYTAKPYEGRGLFNYICARKSR
jgi:hypothetical protein